ncbi:MAG: T9SS type A sorting domain-containing protein [Flavobacteriales bacterium]|nr:T9SS type A sorting domain-containing protein [Flavobacteriales bacterium]
MKRAPLILTLALVVSTELAHAQITLLGTANQTLQVRRSLVSAGTKFLKADTASLTLYNLDFSTFLTINYPPAPAGYTYSGEMRALYITEALFDNDPATVEVIALLKFQNQLKGMRVIRQDGSVLFEDLNYWVGLTAGSHGLNDSPAIFTAEDGNTYMVLTNGSAGNSTKLYQLPGNLPCLACDGTISGFADNGSVESGNLVLYPNPSTTELNLRYPIDTEPGSEIRIIDLQGRIVIAARTNAEGSNVLSLNELAQGQYICTIITSNGPTRSATFSVVR